ncbi:MAG: DUF4412 domain-containing protein [Bacteroidota bacterium]
MKKIFLGASFIICTSIFAQSFEGTIEFKKQTFTDTVNYVYYIKGDMVRIDEIGSKFKKVEGSFIVDIKSNKMFSMSHERKLYSEQSPGTPAVINGKPEVTKTKNIKTLQGYKCTEYIVKNEEEKVEVSYWVANGKFDFFSDLLKTLNRKDKSSVYFQQITDTKGMFPFLSSQKNSEGKEETRLEVTKIQKKIIDANTFEIPKNYQKFQR